MNLKGNKVTDLRKAIKKYVRPGMTLHISTTHSRPNAAVHEIARQFWGNNPRFTIVSLGLTAAVKIKNSAKGREKSFHFGKVVR